MATKKKKSIVVLPVSEMSWQVLQASVMTATEEECRIMLEQEKADKKRMGYMLRIHSRYNVLRAKRERAELSK